MVSLMIAAYIVVDSFGTAANVTGDGAIALIVNKFANGKIKGEALEGDDVSRETSGSTAVAQA